MQSTQTPIGKAWQPRGITLPPILGDAEVAAYERDGFIVLRGAIGEDDLTRLERGLARNPPLDGTLFEARDTPPYPAPGRYTLAHSAFKDPDLVGIAEHPTILAAASQLLRAPVNLTAYVLYDRTPGGQGLPAHYDYKRWRPVGSSMDWLFTIVPFCDYDAETGPLYVAPGSHRVQRVRAGAERPLEVAPPTKPAAADFVDPGLRRGDLLLMNMHLWHRADGNRSNRHRGGAFNKYAAANAPPATGYYLFDEEAAAALDPNNRDLLAVHSNWPIRTTRLLLVQPAESPDDHEILLCQCGRDEWCLPGGPVATEAAIADWDAGNFISALKTHIEREQRIRVPWVSYVGDFPEEDGLTRVYAYDLTGRGFPVSYAPARFCRASELPSAGLQYGYEVEALRRWLDPRIKRGKGLTQAQCRIDQFAY
ncbi:MAG: phytanoyl-CoA dioxygenase family protein [Pseudomonadota bacterium]